MSEKSYFNQVAPKWPIGDVETTNAGLTRLMDAAAMDENTEDTESDHSEDIEEEDPSTVATLTDALVAMELVADVLTDVYRFLENVASIQAKQLQMRLKPGRSSNALRRTVRVARVPPVLESIHKLKEATSSLPTKVKWAL